MYNEVGREDIMYMDEEGMTLATEILYELKASARRWFIAFLIMVVVEAATIAGFLWYISLPIDETTISQEMSDIGSGDDIIQRIGDDYNGTNKTNNNS